ncbi:hypothetical protein [Polluticoccus soli]|uniref:hypothetical protein n=1 Tax=Polluticoccus soli TaxID=3034150 RepID=UPI0023E2F78A|nr:hypothetical protein [Flavipsychrobacter sp. JY13-12]
MSVVIKAGRVLLWLNLSLAALLLMLNIVLALPLITCSDVAPGVSADRIKKVNLGMKLEEVLALLGPPYNYEIAHQMHMMSCRNPARGYYDVKPGEAKNICRKLERIFADTAFCCEGYRNDLNESGFTLEYTRPVEFYAYPMLWVHFDHQFRVRSVFAKKYYWLDEPVIYSLSHEIDSNLLLIPGSKEMYISDWEFERTFNCTVQQPPS